MGEMPRVPDLRREPDDRAEREGQRHHYAKAAPHAHAFENPGGQDDVGRAQQDRNPLLVHVRAEEDDSRDHHQRRRRWIDHPVRRLGKAEPAVEEGVRQRPEVIEASRAPVVDPCVDEPCSEEQPGGNEPAVDDRGRARKGGAALLGDVLLEVEVADPTQRRQPGLVGGGLARPLAHRRDDSRAFEPRDMPA